MALIFIDGFDHYASADMPMKWAGVNSQVIDTANGRRSGSSGLSLGTGNYVYQTFNAVKTAIVGVAINPSALGNAVFNLQDVLGTEQVTVNTTSGGGIAVYRGTSTLLGSSVGGLLSAGAFAYVELKAKIDSTVGTIDVCINGSNVLSLSNVNTQVTSNAQVSIVSLAPKVSSCKYDDFYLCDTSGTSNNNFLGDVRIDALYPNADGTYSAFTPSVAGPHYANVDEATPNTTDYNSGANVGDRDSYAFTDLPALTNPIVCGVQVNIAALKDNTGSRAIAPFLRTGSANKDGASAALSTSLKYYLQVSETDASGAAWTVTTVNAAEAGALVTG